MSNSKRNYYEILNANSSASFNELKSNYKQLILQHHPDKLQQQHQQLQQLEIDINNLEINKDPNNLEFVAITEAWNCLKDSIKRKEYDAEQLLDKFQTHNNIYAHIKLSEMKKQPNTDEYFQGDDDEVNDSRKTAEEENIKDGASKYIYTYDCRCGGQYIVDESAEQYCCPANNQDTQQIINSDNNDIHDDAENKTIDASSSGCSSRLQNDKNNRPNKVKNTKNAGGGGSNSNISAAGGSEGVVLHKTDDDENENDDVDVDVDVDAEEGDGDLIVECSECSLVIVLNG